MPYYTPLRYPGGKRRLAPTVAQLLDANNLRNVEYVEPYAGGAAVGLSLLYEERASRIHINDLDPAVHAFWYAALTQNNKLCERIMTARVNLTEWRRQRAIYSGIKDADSFELGFAAFFLNRTNRSGIIGGGVIGGKSQSSEWGVGARYNKTELVKRVRKVGRFSSRINLSNDDAMSFTRQTVEGLGERAFTFFDPPYIENGEDLYLNTYTLDDHRAIATRITKLAGHWIVTYDYAAAREGLYGGHRRIVYSLPYSAQARYKGKEALFLSRSLRLPTSWRTTRNGIELAGERSRHPLRGRMELVRPAPSRTVAKG